MKPKSTVTAVALACLTFVPAWAQEKSLKSSDVPPPVAASVNKLYPGAVISHWSMETEAGKTTYEASVKDAAGNRDVVVAPDGTLVATEEKVALSTVPAEARQAIKTKYPSATIKGAEKITHDGTVDYEFDLAHASHHEVTISTAGKILKEE